MEQHKPNNKKKCQDAMNKKAQPTEHDVKGLQQEKDDASTHSSEQSTATAPGLDQIQELQTAIESLRKEHQALEDKYLRLAAEYDNYRKRTVKEKSDLLLHGGEKTLFALLPIIDDLERALQHIDASESIEAVKDGIMLINTKFMGYLKAQGVEPMEPIGKPFDMTEQQAVAMVPASEEHPAGSVIDCTKRGYKLHDKVLRYADVVVTQ